MNFLNILNFETGRTRKEGVQPPKKANMRLPEQLPYPTPR
jgi:hypothetical protein